MIEPVFARSALNRIPASIHPENHASIAVVEKLGFRFDRQVLHEDGVSAAHYVVERGDPGGRVKSWEGRASSPTGGLAVAGVTRERRSLSTRCRTAGRAAAA